MIKNKTKNREVCKKVKVLTTILQKATGLMFHKKITDTGYVFVFQMPMRVDLHMFFVFFPIDLLFLDKDKKVIEIKENFKPFTVYYSNNKASYVIELPVGKVRDSKTGLDDILEF